MRRYICIICSVLFFFVSFGAIAEAKPIPTSTGYTASGLPIVKRNGRNYLCGM